MDEEEFNDIAKHLIESLGTCQDGNDYEINADKSGEFWITHKVMGSGEPLKQWIVSVLKNRQLDRNIQQNC
jgi:hypothetical protein